jgi:hypothetical protein
MSVDEKPVFWAAERCAKCGKRTQRSSGMCAGCEPRKKCAGWKCEKLLGDRASTGYCPEHNQKKARVSYEF